MSDSRADALGWIDHAVAPLWRGEGGGMVDFGREYNNAWNAALTLAVKCIRASAPADSQPMNNMVEHVGKAAIAAMRDYTERMSQIGGAVSKRQFGDAADVVGCSIAERCYLAMIDAAISSDGCSAATLFDALKALEAYTTQLIDCGDCGNWDSAKTAEVAKAREVISAYQAGGNS
jgi:hypothetical protein